MLTATVFPRPLPEVGIPTGLFASETIRSWSWRWQRMNGDGCTCLVRSRWRSTIIEEVGGEGYLLMVGEDVWWQAGDVMKQLHLCVSFVVCLPAAVLAIGLIFGSIFIFVCLGFADPVWPIGFYLCRRPVYFYGSVAFWGLMRVVVFSGLLIVYALAFYFLVFVVFERSQPKTQK